MDVKALYPSIKKEMAAQAIKEAMTKPKLEWRNIDMKYLTRYVSLTVDKETIDKHDLSEVVPVPKSTSTINSFVNPSSKSRAKATDGESQFEPPKRNLTKKERDKLIGLVISVGSNVCMENHFYSIDGKVRKQLEGGAIGSVLTGDNARLYMLRWDSKYRLKLKKLGINLDLYVHYVDDTIVVCSAIYK